MNASQPVSQKLKERVVQALSGGAPKGFVDLVLEVCPEIPSVTYPSVRNLILMHEVICDLSESGVVSGYDITANTRVAKLQIKRRPWEEALGTSSC